MSYSTNTLLLKKFRLNDNLMMECIQKIHLSSKNTAFASTNGHSAINIIYIRYLLLVWLGLQINTLKMITLRKKKVKVCDHYSG